MLIKAITDTLINTWLLVKLVKLSETFRCQAKSAEAFEVSTESYLKICDIWRKVLLSVKIREAF